MLRGFAAGFFCCFSKGQKMEEMVAQAIQNAFPTTGLVRLSQIIGDRKKGIPPFIPVSKSAWWAGVASGRYPAAIKLSERTTCWRAEDVRALIQATGEVSSHA